MNSLVYHKKSKCLTGGVSKSLEHLDSIDIVAKLFLCYKLVRDPQALINTLASLGMLQLQDLRGPGYVFIVSMVRYCLLRYYSLSNWVVSCIHKGIGKSTRGV